MDINTSLTSLGNAAKAQLGVFGNRISAAFGEPPAPAMGEFANVKDMRARLRVPISYMISGDPSAGPSDILLKNQGILFPYTPTISMDNRADYGTASPLHSNFAFYFFKNASVGPITVTAKFTVQNEFDGAVLLGVIHLLRSLTKMPWGDEARAGSPPPVCRLDAFGDFMYSNVPVALTSWRHELPDNVDYITVGRPGSPHLYGHSMVPSLSSITMTFNVMYSRQEMAKYNVTDWLKYANAFNKGYL